MVLKTIKTIDDLYLYISKHLLIQGRKSSVFDSNFELCKYRTKDGLSCSIGCIISDDNYDPSFEGTLITENKNIQNAIEQSIERPIDDAEFEILILLQRIHDSLFQNLQYWRKQLLIWAYSLKLQKSIDFLIHWKLND